ncbi:30312_t:CDS:2, partial [Racocetra persica]
FLAFPLLQEPKSFKSLNLLDFSLYIKLVSYHPSITNTTHQVANDLILTKLLSPFKIDIYLVRICDLETAKKKNLKIGDVLKDPNDIKRHQLKDEFDILMNYSVEISCSTDCIFNDYVIIMCRPFLKEKQKTCEILNNDNESIIYNTENYRVIMVIDYMDWMYQGRIKDGGDIADNDKIELGDTFERYNSGYPVMISGGSIEVAYHPDMTNINNYINCCAKKYEKQNIIKIKEEEINEFLMLTIIEKASTVLISIPQKPILIPQPPSVPILIPQNPKPILIPQPPSVPIVIPQKPILISQPSVPILIPPEESNDINDKNIFN